MLALRGGFGLWRGPVSPLFCLLRKVRPLGMGAVYPILEEPRVVREVGLSGRVALVAESVVAGLGFRLLWVRTLSHGRFTVQVTIERCGDIGVGGVGVDECARVSRALSAALDVEGVISTGYVLEVSSPGVNRPLVRVSDFGRCAGSELRVRLHDGGSGRKGVRGVLVTAGEDGIRLCRHVDGAEVETFFSFSSIREARLVGGSLPLSGQPAVRGVGVAARRL